MRLPSAPIHLVRKAFPHAAESQLMAYALEEEHVMTAFADDDERDGARKGD